MSVNMFRLRLTTDAHARWKNGQPPQRTTGVARTSCSQAMSRLDSPCRSGWPFFERGWASIVNRSLNMFTLIALGTGVAYVYSVVATLAPSLFPVALRTPGGQVGSV